MTSSDANLSYLLRVFQPVMIYRGGPVRWWFFPVRLDKKHGMQNGTCLFRTKWTRVWGYRIFSGLRHVGAFNSPVFVFVEFLCATGCMGDRHGERWLGPAWSGGCWGHSHSQSSRLVLTSVTIVALYPLLTVHPAPCRFVSVSSCFQPTVLQGARHRSRVARTVEYSVRLIKVSYLVKVIGVLTSMCHYFCGSLWYWEASSISCVTCPLLLLEEEKKLTKRARELAIDRR